MRTHGAGGRCGGAAANRTTDVASRAGGGAPARRDRRPVRRRHQRGRPSRRAAWRSAGRQHLARAHGPAARVRRHHDDSRPSAPARPARASKRSCSRMAACSDIFRSPTNTSTLGGWVVTRSSRPAVATLRPHRAAVPCRSRRDAAGRMERRRRARSSCGSRPARGADGLGRPPRPADRSHRARPPPARSTKASTACSSRRGRRASTPCARWSSTTRRCRCCGCPTRSRPKPSSRWRRATRPR